MAWTPLVDLFTRLGTVLLSTALRKGAQVQWEHDERDRKVITHITGGKLTIIDKREIKT